MLSHASGADSDLPPSDRAGPRELQRPVTNRNLASQSGQREAVSESYPPEDVGSDQDPSEGFKNNLRASKGQEPENVVPNKTPPRIKHPRLY